MGDNGRFLNPGGAQGTLGFGQGVFCGRHGVHPMPQGVGRRVPAMGMAATEELDGVLRLQSCQGDVCPAQTAILGDGGRGCTNTGDPTITMTPWSYQGGIDTLRKLQQEMFKGTECSLTGWHPWKRMGAACFRALGGSLQALTIWARWRTPRHAARYAAHPPAWKMLARALLPRPTGNTGHFTRDCEWLWMPVRDLWHADAFAWDAGRKWARQPPTVQSFARPITPEEVDSESDDDDMEDDKERPVDEAAAGHKTPKDQGGEACHGGKGDVVAAELGVEHDPMVATGAGVRTERRRYRRPTWSGEQPAAEEEQMQSRGDDDPSDDGQDASGAEQNAEPTDTAQIEREGHEHTMEPEGEGQRGNGTLEGSGPMPPEGAADGAQEDVEDEDSGRDSGSLETSWDVDATEPEGTAGEASCSIDCSQPRWRIHAARRTTLGKRDSGQRDPMQERSPKRSRTGEADDTNGRYIDVDVPGGPEEDGAPHWGYVVTAPQRGNRFQLWCPVHLKRSDQGTAGAADGRDSPH